MANRPHRRSEETRVAEWVSQALAHRIDRELARGNDPSAVVIGRRVSRALRRAQSNRLGWAKLVLAVLAEQRIICRAGDMIRGRARAAARVRFRGGWHEVEIPERYAAPRRDGAGFPAGNGRDVQYPLWVELPFEELRAQILDDERQVSRDELRIAVKRKGLALQAQYPTAKNVKEACILAGLDWRVFLAQ